MNKTVLKHSSIQEFKLNPAHHLVYIKPLITEEISVNIKTTLVQIMPDGQIKPHTHETLEVFYIISGQGEALINDQWLACGAGDVIYAPAGVVHSIKNTGDQIVELIANFPKYTA